VGAELRSMMSWLQTPESAVPAEPAGVS